MAETDEKFTELDTNHDGSLEYSEIKVGLEALAKAHDYTITAADKKWVEGMGKKNYKETQGKLNKKQFNVFANDVVVHFGICPP